MTVRDNITDKSLSNTRSAVQQEEQSVFFLPFIYQRLDHRLPVFGEKHIVHCIGIETCVRTACNVACHYNVGLVWFFVLQVIETITYSNSGFLYRKL